MYARSTAVRAVPESIDAGIEFIRDEVMPALLAMDGCVGLSLLVDRASGRCIATSAWETERAMQASEYNARPLRDRAAEILGDRAQVDEWEIALVHRDHPTAEGACVRATWMRFMERDFQRAVNIYKLVSVPALANLEGFCSASLLANHEAGIAVSSVTYDSREAMECNRSDADAVRSTVAREAGVEVLDVCEFDLALAHLRVPELA